MIYGPDNRPLAKSDYDAIDASKGKRLAPRTEIKFEDFHLDRTQRKSLNATTIDQQRNFALVAWMVDCHLDYVASFDFQSRTGDRPLDREIEAAMDEWMSARTCDIARRHHLQRLIRLAEATRVLGGDCAIIRTNTGRLQIVEPNRIARPTIDVPPDWPVNEVHGVEVDPVTTEALRYAVCNRSFDGGTTGSLKFAGWADARYCDMLGYYTRPDQIRGVSPMSSAVNTVQDLYETFDANLAKAKLHALLGVFFGRDSAEGMTGAGELDDETGDTPDSTTERYRMPIKGLLKVEGLPGDTVEMLESKTPSQEFQSFSEAMVHVALCALGIPMTFYDSRRSSYAAARQDLLRYVLSVKKKRQDIAVILDNIARWKLSFFTRGNIIRLPRGKDFRFLRWEWVPAGIPWIDPLKEMSANMLAMASGATSLQRLHKEAGHGDAFDTIDEIAAIQKYAREVGAQISTSTAPNIVINEGEPEQ